MTTKTIRIKPGTHKALRLLQAEWGFRSLDATIQRLLDHGHEETVRARKTT